MKTYKNLTRKADKVIYALRARASAALTNDKGEFYVDKLIAVIACVVLGGGLIVALTAILGKNATTGLFKTISDKITALFPTT